MSAFAGAATIRDPGLLCRSEQKDLSGAKLARPHSRPVGFRVSAGPGRNRAKDFQLAINAQKPSDLRRAPAEVLRRRPKKGIPSGPPISDYYPAVIDKATFDAAQAARQQNLAHRGRKGIDLANIFGDLCSCGYCGGKVIFHRISNVQVLVCEQVLNDGACSRSAWTYKDFEITVLVFLAHPALLDQAGYEQESGLLDLVEEIKGLSFDQERRYARRVNITVLLKRIVAGLLIHSAGSLGLPRHSSAQIRKDIAGRFLEIQLQGGPSYPCISIG
ncbi:MULTISPECIES: hypothetical protein [unclassified Bradyrhizobium]|uniref:hypothetical protein n=1 Tax=unclassified Bradyrhizobium TaxID=2631580 RepID=UPI003393449E